jgi:hypothetical protein
MKKIYLLGIVLASAAALAQSGARPDAGFDEQKYRKLAYERHIPPQDVEGYIRAERSKYILQQHPELAHQKKEHVTLVNMSKLNSQTIQTNYCPNVDFSALDYTNWTGDIANNCSNGGQYPVGAWLGSGFNGNGGTTIVSNTDPCNGATISADRHVVMSIPTGALTNSNVQALANGYDPTCCNTATGFYDLPVVPPGGGTSLRLGSAYPNYTCEKAVYAITPSFSNSLFTYQFAVVINDGGHGVGEQPAFLMRLKDMNGNQLGGSCGFYAIDATAAMTDPSYTQNSSGNPCWSSGSSSTWYRQWEARSLDLTSYIGQTVFIEFEAIDCIWSGHFCYAYIWGSCQPLNLNVSMCASGSSQQITAPGGYAAYQWYGPNNPGNAIAGATTSTLTLTNGIVGDMYYVDMITVSGCTTKVQAALQYSYLDILYNGSVVGNFNGNDTLGLCNGSSINLVVQGANTYTWSANAGSSNNDSVTVTPAPGSLTYSVIGTGTNGCIDTSFVTFVLDSSGCVWPGDADENLVVDNLDLFPVGIKYGVAGATRAFQSNAWYGYACTNWMDTMQNGTNTKYVDCNGSGQVDFADTLAIGLNYNNTHPLKMSQSHNSLANADLYLQFSKSLYYPGDTLLADVMLGSSSNQQANIYGSAFTLDYDQSAAKSGSEKFNYVNSWMGNVNQQFIRLEKIFTAPGYVDAAQVRINHSTVNGFGKIATLKFILKDTINGNGWLYFSFSNAVMTDDQGELNTLGAGADSVAVAVNGVGVAVKDRVQHVAVFPNPSSGSFAVNSTENIDELKVIDILGNTVQVLKPCTQKVHLSLEAEGVYFFRIKSGGESVLRKVVVSR